MTPKLFPLNKSIIFLIYRAHTQGVTALRKDLLAAGFDLTPEQWAIMAHLQKTAGMSQAQLGEKSLKDRHNINRIINILDERGYVKREPDEDDKRAYRLFLTPSGTETLRKSTPIFLNHVEKRFNGISAADLAVLRRILEQTIKNIEK